MARLARQANLNPLLRQTALSLVGGPFSSDTVGFCRSVEEYLRALVVLVDEPEELIQTPVFMLQTIARDRITYGDCDDVATLGAALVTALGIQCRFVALRPRGSPVYVHVFVECNCNGRIVRIDPTITRGRVIGHGDERMECEI